VSDQPQRSFSTQFKIGLIERIEAGERLPAVAAAAGIKRKLLYEWRAAWRAFGAAGLNRKRGPKPGWKTRAGSPPGRASPDTPPGPDGAPDASRPGGEPVESLDLAAARARIGELERVIGRQQADLHFFREALRLWDAESHNGDAPISIASSKK